MKTDDPIDNLSFLAFLLALARFCWQKLGCNVRNNATLGDNNIAQELSKPEIMSAKILG